MPLKGWYIREQVKLFYRDACHKHGADKPFVASVGWLCHFLKCKELRHVRVTGEHAPADELAVKEHPAILRGIIEEGGYTRDQIYNMDEMALYYKAVPKSTYISKQQRQAPGCKTDKNKMAVKFTVNLSGSHKMWPVVVHTAAHPRCYRNLRNITDSGVYWNKSTNG